LERLVIRPGAREFRIEKSSGFWTFVEREIEKQGENNEGAEGGQQDFLGTGIDFPEQSSHSGEYVKI
jgi:hypothetical protein